MVTGREYSFDPDRVVVRGAGPLTIELRNDGDLAHNLRVRRDGEDVGGTPSFPGGRDRVRPRAARARHLRAALHGRATTPSWA